MCQDAGHVFQLPLTTTPLHLLHQMLMLAPPVTLLTLIIVLTLGAMVSTAYYGSLLT